jgi:hypothetical protein
MATTPPHTSISALPNQNLNPITPPKVGPLHLHRSQNPIHHQNIPENLCQHSIPHWKHNSTTPLKPPHTQPPNIYDRSRIYELTCPDCSKKYIGQTGRSFSVHFKEHFREFSKNNTKSKFSEHLLQCHHSIAPKTTIMKPLCFTKKGNFMKTVEKYFIYRETIYNNQLNDKHTIHPNLIFETLARICPQKGYSPPPPD